jgi:hypothetical protein
MLINESDYDPAIHEPADETSALRCEALAAARLHSVVGNISPRAKGRDQRQCADPKLDPLQMQTRNGRRIARPVRPSRRTELEALPSSS